MDEQGVTFITFNTGYTPGAKPDTHYSFPFRLRHTATILNEAIARALKLHSRNADCSMSMVVVCLQEFHCFYVQDLLTQCGLLGEMQCVPLANPQSQSGRPILYSKGLELVECEHRQLNKRTNGADVVHSDGVDSSADEREDGLAGVRAHASGSPLSGTAASDEHTMTIARFAIKPQPGSTDEGSSSHTQAHFCVANLHISSACEKARRLREQARFLRALVKRSGCARRGGPGERAVPCFFTGDFNENHDDVFPDTRAGAPAPKPVKSASKGSASWSKSLGVLADSAWHLARAHGRFADGRDGRNGWPYGSCHGWALDRKVNARLIDWLLIAKDGNDADGRALADSCGSNARLADADVDVRVRSAQFLIPERWRPNPNLPATADNDIACERWKETLGGGRLADVSKRFPGDHFPLEFELSITWRHARPDPGGARLRAETDSDDRSPIGNGKRARGSC